MRRVLADLGLDRPRVWLTGLAGLTYLVVVGGAVAVAAVAVGVGS